MTRGKDASVYIPRVLLASLVYSRLEAHAKYSRLEAHAKRAHAISYI
jgi:hypothetical protein